MTPAVNTAAPETERLLSVALKSADATSITGRTNEHARESNALFGFSHRGPSLARWPHGRDLDFEIVHVYLPGQAPELFSVSLTNLLLLKKAGSGCCCAALEKNAEEVLLSAITAAVALIWILMNQQFQPNGSIWFLFGFFFHL